MTTKSRVNPSLYDQRYFNESGGSSDYLRGELSPWMKEIISLANISPDCSILDIGCGRGEIISYCANYGARTIGLDYSTIALKISASNLNVIDSEICKCGLVHANAINLPFLNESFDIIFMMDIIEHLYPDELKKALVNVKRILRPAGTLLIHTMPNANYLKYGYPIYRFLCSLLRRKLPRDPRKRVYHGEVHVNEQSPNRLKSILVECGFNSVRIRLTQISGNKFKRFVSTIFGIRQILANDIFAVVKNDV